MRKATLVAALAFSTLSVWAQDNGGNIFRPNAHSHKHVSLAPSYAWSLLEPHGLHEEATLDTTMLN